MQRATKPSQDWHTGKDTVASCSCIVAVWKGHVGTGGRRPCPLPCPLPPTDQTLHPHPIPCGRSSWAGHLESISRHDKLWAPLLYTVHLNDQFHNHSNRSINVYWGGGLISKNKRIPVYMLILYIPLLLYFAPFHDICCIQIILKLIYCGGFVNWIYPSSICIAAWW